MTSVPLAGDDFDLDKYKNMDPVQMMLAIRRRLEYKMPPVGETTTRAQVGGKQFTRVTWRCDREGCYYICTPRDPSNLEYLKNHHYHGQDGTQCPTPPRRESLPSGLAEIEKLWREIDDVVVAIKDKVAYRGMEGPGLNGYVKGLAFSIVMKDKELWPDIRSVSREAMRRWQMHKGDIPYSATPTRFSNNFEAFQSGGWKSDEPAPKAATAPIRRTTPVKKAPPRVPALPPETVTAIKAALKSGIMAPEIVANMYGVSVEQVKLLNSNAS